MKRLALLLIPVFLLGTAGVFAEVSEANKDILKKAIQGAVTGAVSAEASKDGAAATAAPAVPAASEDKDSDGEHHHHHGKHKHKNKQNWKKDRRPPGWDKGKKTGWGDSDVPPGLAKKGDR